MSKFAYKAEGELNSQYLLDLLKEYLTKILDANGTKGIVEDDYKINPNASTFARWFNDKTKRIGFKFKGGNLLENYNKVLSTKYASAILDKIDIFLQTNVLTPKQIWELKQTLQAINFNGVLPLIDENRENAIKSSQKRFLKVLNDIKYLSNASSEYILYNSPVSDLKPFLSDKVSVHTIDFVELQKLIIQFVNLRYNELNTFNFNEFEPTFVAKCEDFYNDNITDNGIGEEVEKFIRSKMLEKLEILKHEERLPEELNAQIAQVDTLLKQLKLNKIEKMMQKLITLKTNLAQAKEVVDSCKDTINASTIPNKAQMFLVMDNLYYKLSKKCDTLQQKVKLKLQLVDKVKMFNMLEALQNHPQDRDIKKDEVLSKSAQNNAINTKKMQNNANLHTNKDSNIQENKQKPNIASNLYDDDEVNEIHISEDDDEGEAEDEIIIDEDK